MNGNRLTKLLASAIVGLAMLAAPSSPASMEPAVGKSKLEQLAKEASTPEQHAEVAKHYREWAEALDKKAVEHEQAAAKLAKRWLPALAHKWPAMVPNRAAKEKQLAIQSRRAAQKAREIALRHISLAVEARAKPSQPGW